MKIQSQIQSVPRPKWNFQYFCLLSNVARLQFRVNALNMIEPTGYLVLKICKYQQQRLHNCAAAEFMQFSRQ